MAEIARARASSKIGEIAQWWAGRCEIELEDFIRAKIKEAINLGLYRIEIRLGKHPSPVMDYLNATNSMKRGYLGHAIKMAFRNLKNEGFKCELCFYLLDYPRAWLPNKYHFFAALMLEYPEFYEIKIRW